MQSTLLTPTSFTVQSETPEGQHVAIIMDGNGRWATQRGRPRVLGHRAGGAAARRVIELLARMLAQELNAGSSDVDPLIRTGGEKRLSDFLLWESAYAELLFTDCMWPDFDASDLDAALQEFRRRERRCGGAAEAARECPVRSVGGAR
jgi:undecaprenyl diphosphate synthase